MRNLKLLFVMMLALFLQPSVMNAQSSNEQELKELKQLLAESKQQLESGKEKDMKGKVKDMTESSRQALRSKIAEIENRINELSQKAALEEQRKQESTQQEAQQVLTAIAQGEITSDLTKMGYTLTRTTEIDGMKCEHYEKGTEELRTFKKSNGDFFTCKEDLNGFNKAPDDKEKAIGSLRLTSEDGIVLERLNDTYSVVLKNGNRFLMEGIGIPYKEFKKPYSFYGTLKSFYEKKIKVVYLANNPNVAYPCTNGNITIGNRVYACDVEGNFTPYMMTATVEGSDEKVSFYASPTDVS